MPEIPKGRIEVFTQQDVTTIQQSFADRIEQLYIKTFNKATESHNFNNIKTRLDFIELLEDMLDLKNELKTDIKIETTPDKK